MQKYKKNHYSIKKILGVAHSWSSQNPALLHVSIRDYFLTENETKKHY